MFNEGRRNWKTTAAGVLAGCVPIVLGYLQGDLTAEKCILGLGIAVLGYFAKDGNVTGVVNDNSLK